jgi:hypothetical protein
MGEKKPVAYLDYFNGTPLYILGSYENVCGGMDTISDKADRLALIKKYMNKEGVVIFEGLITGKTYGAIGAVSDRQKGRWVYAFMDTPWEVCVERVLARRREKGNDAPFDPLRTMWPTFKACASVAARAKAEGHHVVWVNHTLKPPVAAHKLLAYAIAKGGVHEN